MLLYVFVVTFPLFMGYLYDMSLEGKLVEGDKLSKSQLQQRWIYLIVAALPMFSLIAFRHADLGADSAVYQRIFREVTNTSWEYGWNAYGFEKGFIAFEKIVALFTDSPLVYQCVYSSIYMLAVVHFANQLEKSHFLFLYFFGTLGLYTFMFTGVRQCLAMCICLYSYKYIKSRKVLKFLICMIFAFYFHKSAVLFLAAYVIFKNKVKPLYIFLYSTVCALVYYYFEQVQGWFNQQFDYSYTVEETGNGVIFLLVMIVITVFSIYSLTLYKKMNDETRGIVNISFIALAFWVLRLISRTAERPSYYFLFFTAAMLGISIESIDEKSSKNTMTTIVVILCLVLFVYRMSTNFSTMVPYMIYSEDTVSLTFG